MDVKVITSLPWRAISISFSLHRDVSTWSKPDQKNAGGQINIQNYVSYKLFSNLASAGQNLHSIKAPLHYLFSLLPRIEVFSAQGSRNTPGLPVCLTDGVGVVTWAVVAGGGACSSFSSLSSAESVISSRSSSPSDPPRSPFALKQQTSLMNQLCFEHTTQSIHDTKTSNITALLIVITYIDFWQFCSHILLSFSKPFRPWHLLSHFSKSLLGILVQWRTLCILCFMVACCLILNFTLHSRFNCCLIKSIKCYIRCTQTLNLSQAERFHAERPEILIAWRISIIRYLFHIKNLAGNSANSRQKAQKKALSTRIRFF